MFHPKPRIVALIPLRGGSKSIPLKNIKPIVGKPLCYWVLKAAKDSKYIQDIYVSTDSQKIKDVIKKFDFDVNVIDRPAHLATDKATTDAVMTHFMKQVDFDILFTIQATSPMTTSSDLDKAYRKFIKEKADSLVTGVITKKFLWRMNSTPVNYDPIHRPMRQDFTDEHKIMMENGAFYITKRKILEKYKCRLGGKTSLYPMSQDFNFEIDEPEDWGVVEKILLKNSK